MLDFESDLGTSIETDILKEMLHENKLMQWLKVNSSTKYRCSEAITAKIPIFL
jgi:hypothetical protein